MFKIIPDPTFTVDVPLTVPGQKEQVTVGMTFKYKDKDALKSFNEKLSRKEISAASVIRTAALECAVKEGEELKSSLTCIFEKYFNDISGIEKYKIEDILSEIIDNWTGIDADCNAESIKALCANYIMAPSEIIAAYNKELVLSKAKN